jgi:hypothetical protein
MLTSLIAADVSSKRGLAQMPDRVALAAGAIAGSCRVRTCSHLGWRVDGYTSAL